MQLFFDYILAYYNLPLPIGSDEIIKRLQMRLNSSQCGHKEWLTHSCISFLTAS